MLNFAVHVYITNLLNNNDLYIIENKHDINEEWWASKIVPFYTNDNILINVIQDSRSSEFPDSMTGITSWAVFKIAKKKNVTFNTPIKYNKDSYDPFEYIKTMTKWYDKEFIKNKTK